MNKKLNKNNGITLIALVISIIVMLILVAASISMAVNGGLFNYAGKAVGDTRNAINQEQELIDDIINNHIKPNTNKDNAGGEGEITPENPETPNQTETETTLRGAFVKYEVTYKDVYIDKEYTNTNGWRLLRYDSDDNGKTIYNVELISTGVPAKLSNYTVRAATWWADETTIENFKTTLKNYYDKTSEYTFYSKTANNVKAAAGMYYNLEIIPLKTYSSTVENEGKYSKITINGTEITEDTTGNIFKTSSDYGVRMLTLPEINKDRSNSEGITITSTSQIASLDEPAIGLYILQNLKNISGMNNYDYSSYIFYWLASPNCSNRLYLLAMNCDGWIFDSGNDVDYGIRPVVHLGSNIKYTVSSNIDSNKIEYLTLTKMED